MKLDEKPKTNTVKLNSNYIKNIITNLTKQGFKITHKQSSKDQDDYGNTIGFGAIELRRSKSGVEEMINFVTHSGGIWSYLISISKPDGTRILYIEEESSNLEDAKEAVLQNLNIHIALCQRAMQNLSR